MSSEPKRVVVTYTEFEAEVVLYLLRLRRDAPPHWLERSACSRAIKKLQAAQERAA